MLMLMTSDDPRGAEAWGFFKSLLLTLTSLNWQLLFVFAAGWAS